MNTADDVLLVWSSVPDQDCAQSIAQALVEARLAACVHIFAAGTSVYRWQDGVERADENMLLIKTRKSIYDALATRLCALHPYEVPEILAVSTCNGLPAYLDWLVLQTQTEDN